ncbi:MAG: RNA polymerase subunit sigma-70, partial [Acidobacteria bacterium]|nr:RNA polymerase subunit sigma-70 [Acidobacteriota bacterium]
MTEPRDADEALSTSPKEVTDLLLRWNSGDPQALDRLIPLVTQELRRIAAAYFRREPEGHTLQPTAVVNECYLRLIDRQRVSFKDRSHFFAFAARTMRRILVDHARTRKAAKRGEGVTPLTLSAAENLQGSPDLDLLELEGALEQLASLNERQARIVELRFFG